MFSRECARHNDAVAVPGPILPRRSRCLRTLTFLMPFLCLLLAPFAVFSQEQLIVRVVLNGEPRGDFFIVRDGPGEFLLRKDDLQAIGVAAEEGAAMRELEGEQYIALSSLADAVSSFDEKNLTLTLTAPQPTGEATVIDLSPPPPQKFSAYPPRESSAFLNYDLDYAYGDPGGFQSLRGTTMLGARSGDLLFLTDSTFTKTDVSSRSVRLSSALSYERRDDLRRYTAGDYLSSSGDLGSTFSAGGIEVSKVYSMDPYFITWPVFGISGTARLPSEVDLYMDGVLVSRRSVGPGDFALANLNYYGGARNAELVIRDASGKVERISASAYFTDALLKGGLHAYRYSAGFLREQYGTKSSEYGDAAFSLFHRYGIDDRTTIGGRAEGTSGVRNGGLQAWHLFPKAGVLSAAGSLSSGRGAGGSAASLSHSYRNGRFGADLLARRYTRDYATVGPPSAALRPRSEGSLAVSYTATAWGSFTAGWFGRQNANGTVTRVPSAGYSRRLFRSWTLTLTSRTVREERNDHQLFALLSYTPRNDLSISAQYQSGREAHSETLQASKPTPVGEGYGYRVVADRSTFRGRTASSLLPYLQYNGPYGSYTLDGSLRRSEGRNDEQYRFGAAGSLVYAAGAGFGAGRPVGDSFSLVTVGDRPDVPVLLNNQEVGRTNRAGRAVVPNLSSYRVNQLTVDASAIPMNYTVASTSSNIIPSRWSGSCVSYDVTKVQAVTGRLLMERDGGRTPLELREVLMQVGERTVRFPTGKGGEFYLESALPWSRGAAAEDPRSCAGIAERRRKGGAFIQPGQYPAAVLYRGRECTFTVSIPDDEEIITDLGEIVCSFVPEPVSVEAMPEAVRRTPAPAEELPFEEEFLFRYDGEKGFVPGGKGYDLPGLKQRLRDDRSLAVEIDAHGGIFGTDMQVLMTGTTLLKMMKKELLDAGLPDDRISRIKNFGKSRPLCSEFTPECDRKNQRVIVRLVPYVRTH